VPIIIGYNYIGLCGRTFFLVLSLAFATLLKLLLQMLPRRRRLFVLIIILFTDVKR